MVELQQYQDRQDRAEHILQQFLLHERPAEAEIDHQLDRGQDDRIDDDDGNERHDDARDDLLEPLIGGEVVPFLFQGLEIQHGNAPRTD